MNKRRYSASDIAGFLSIAGALDPGLEALHRLHRAQELAKRLCWSDHRVLQVLARLRCGLRPQGSRAPGRALRPEEKRAFASLYWCEDRRHSVSWWRAALESIIRCPLNLLSVGNTLDQIATSEPPVQVPPPTGQWSPRHLGRLCQRRGLWPGEVAPLLGLSVAEWTAILHGELSPPASLLPRIAGVLGLPIADLFVHGEVL